MSYRIPINTNEEFISMFGAKCVSVTTAVKMVAVCFNESVIAKASNKRRRKQEGVVSWAGRGESGRIKIVLPIAQKSICQKIGNTISKYNTS